MVALCLALMTLPQAQSFGIATVGHIPGGIPWPGLPTFDSRDLDTLIDQASPAEIAEMRDPASAAIDEDERAALAYAEELTLRPGDISDDVYEELRRHFGESQIVEITMIAALYNMVNRFNEALKLDLEPY